MNPEKTEPQGQKSAWWVWLLLLCAVGGAAYLFLPRIAQTSAAAKEKKGGKGGDANRPVPVVAAMARRGDMPVYLNGLGSVTAFYTVTVQTRVDGEMMKCRFQEGQMVKQGDLWWRSIRGRSRSSWSRRKGRWRRIRPCSPTPSSIWSATKF